MAEATKLQDGEAQNPNLLSPEWPVRNREGLMLYSYEDLKLYTENFSAKNFIGTFQFGKVYRGFIDANEVTVKIWELEGGLYVCFREHNRARMRDEVYLLNHPKFDSHPNLVKLIGYCFEDDVFGVVYDLKSLDNVRNLILADNLSWYQRVKVALGFACLVRDFHAEDPPYLPHLLRNINASHLMLDQDYNLKLYDFSMISGGIFPDRRNYPNQVVAGCWGYIDPIAWYCTEDTDVFAFGVVLLMLITNSVLGTSEEPDDICLHEWAKKEYKPRKSCLWFGHGEGSLVLSSLKEDPFFYSCDGRKITELAIDCVDKYPWNRPTMDDIVKCLSKLRIVRRFAKGLGVDQMLHGHHTKLHKPL